MSLHALFVANEPDWVARGFTAISIGIAGFSLYIARRNYQRSGYKVTIDLKSEVDIMRVDPGKYVRTTRITVGVANHRMGKIQIVRFLAESPARDTYEISCHGPGLGHTLDGIQREEWFVIIADEILAPDDEPAFKVPTRIGAQLANGERVWSEWITISTNGKAKLGRSSPQVF